MRTTTAFVALLLLGCKAEIRSSTAHEPREAPSDDPFEARLLEIAREYNAWPRVSDRANWAPTLCTIPPPAGVQRSDSEDATTHGRKLYYLFAKDAESYHALDFAQWSSPEEREALKRDLIGQVVVKESWKPIEVAPADVPRLQVTKAGDRAVPENFFLDGERAYRIGEPDGLFVMFKLDPLTPNTDQGWVYGTVTADGERVTSSGRVESCMRCHVENEFDRLFGLFPAAK